MAQINNDFRHHLVNGLCGIRSTEEKIRSGYKYVNVNGEYTKVELTPEDIKDGLDNIDYQLKRIFKALNELESEDIK